MVVIDLTVLSPLPGLDCLAPQIPRLTPWAIIFRPCRGFRLPARKVSGVGRAAALQAAAGAALLGEVVVPTRAGVNRLCTH